MIEKHSAIFVTDKQTLIALEETEYSWMTFSWFIDRSFLAFLSSELEKKPQPKIKMSCDNAQIPSQWLRGKHYLLTYHEWVALCQRFLRTSRSPEGEDDFSDFRRGCLIASKERLLDLIEDLNGLYRIVDFEVFVVLSTVRPHWETEKEGMTSIEKMKSDWEEILTNLENSIKELMRTANETNTDTPK